MGWANDQKGHVRPDEQSDFNAHPDFNADFVAVFTPANLIATEGREAQVAERYLLYSAFSAVPFGLLYIATSFKTGMRQPLFATGANALRLIALPLILIPLAMQIEDTFEAIPMASVLSGIVIGVAAFIIVMHQVRRLK